MADTCNLSARTIIIIALRIKPTIAMAHRNLEEIKESGLGSK
jgi:hypothetical protein